jgi:subtilisin family serine protease/subtilisin-like proprotein convertase family protein
VEALEPREVPAKLAADPTAFDPAHVLVRWTDGLLHPTGYGLGARALGTGVFRVNLPAVATVDQALAMFRARPGVAFAQPDYRVQLTATPDDPSIGSLWGMDAIGAPEAWNTGTGTGHTIVAVIDSGVGYNHPDLKANMWHNPGEIPGNGLDDDHDGYVDDAVGYNFVANTGNPADDNGHGTHVAGTIGAVGDNGIGVAGVDWHVRIMALKFLDASGSGYTSDAVRALNFAVAHGAKVVNASFGGAGYDPALATAIASARAKGAIVVAAAGNDGTDDDANPVYPANYAGDNVVSVAATDRDGRLASFSNYGAKTVDIAAPGVGIYSTLPNGKYGTYSGTSMATPHVAGALALVWDAHPTWSYRQVIAAVLNTADRLPSLTGKVAAGLLDVGRAITYDAGATPPPARDSAGATVTAVTFGGGASINTARVGFSEAIKAPTFTASDVTLTAPGGNVIPVNAVTAVTGTGGTQFDVTFPAQSANGTYTLVVGPNVLDLAGNPMDQNRNGRPGEAADKYTATTTVAGAKTYASTDVGKVIPDLGTVVSRLTIADATMIRDLNVRVTASHHADADMRITLVGPDGTRVVLFNRRGGSGNDLADTTFDDEAPNSVWRGTAPFAGSYKPEYVLSAFDGKSAKGTWSLIIDDLFPVDSGKLWAWSLTVDGAPAARPAAAAHSAGLPAAPPSPVAAPAGGPWLSSMFVRL